MKNKAKQLYEKMVDFKRFATFSLAVGAFFYIGAILPVHTNSMMDVKVRMIVSAAFIAMSLWLFIEAKSCRSQLLELDEGEEFLMKK